MMSQVSVEPAFLTIPEAAERAGVRLDRVRLIVRRFRPQLLAEGVLEPVGNRFAVRREKLDRFVLVVKN